MMHGVYHTTANEDGTPLRAMTNGNAVRASTRARAARLNGTSERTTRECDEKSVQGRRAS